MLRRCNHFKHWIENNGLIDLGFSGPKYRWTRGRNWDTMKCARLDRALYSMEWRTRFQEGAVRHLIQSHLDHTPLLISTTGFIEYTESKKPFRFQVAWLTDEGFEKFIGDNWHSQQSLTSNLNKLALELSKWNSDVFGNLFRKKRQLWGRIEGIQTHVAEGGPRHLMKLESRLHQELDLTLNQIKTLWH